jgi:hypothetical protein
LSIGKRIVVFLALFAIMVSTMVAVSQAHKAHTGMKYPFECCHEQDCAPVDSVARTNPTDGSLPQLIVTTKHGTVAVPNDFIPRMSEDNQMHACMRPKVWGGAPSGAMNLICLFVPPTM